VVKARPALLRGHAVETTSRLGVDASEPQVLRCRTLAERRQLVGQRSRRPTGRIDSSDPNLGEGDAIDAEPERPVRSLVELHQSFDCLEQFRFFK
jgi:hypothetical protein